MKYATLTSLAALLVLTAASSQAATVQGRIPVSAQIVSGVSVSAFVVNGEPVAIVRAGGVAARSQPLPYGAPPLVVSFETKRGAVLTQRTTWDSSLHLLTIDF
jgi:hypothetical protein